MGNSSATSKWNDCTCAGELDSSRTMLTKQESTEEGGSYSAKPISMHDNDARINPKSISHWQLISYQAALKASRSQCDANAMSASQLDGEIQRSHQQMRDTLTLLFEERRMLMEMKAKEQQSDKPEQFYPHLITDYMVSSQDERSSLQQDNHTVCTENALFSETMATSGTYVLELPVLEATEPMKATTTKAIVFASDAASSAVVDSIEPMQAIVVEDDMPALYTTVLAIRQVYEQDLSTQNSSQNHSPTSNHHLSDGIEPEPAYVGLPMTQEFKRESCTTTSVPAEINLAQNSLSYQDERCPLRRKEFSSRIPASSNNFSPRNPSAYTTSSPRSGKYARFPKYAPMSPGISAESSPRSPRASPSTSAKSLRYQRSSEEASYDKGLVMSFLSAVDILTGRAERK